jgi:hypothetical protein
MGYQEKAGNNFLAAVTIFLSIVISLPVWAGEPKPGDVINSSNIEQYKDYFPPFMARYIQDGCGLETPVVVSVKEPGKVPGAPAKFLEASRANAGKATLKEDGTLDGYISGYPFPDPKEPNKALKIVWNQFYRFRGDSSYSGKGFQVISRRKGGSVRSAASEFFLLRYMGRTCVEPIPELSNPKGLYWAAILNGKTPPSKDMATLTWRYNDPGKNDDMWAYVPTLRRTLRLMSSERSNPIHGYPMSWDDAFGFDGKISLFYFELMREQKILALMDQKINFINTPLGGYHHPIVFGPDEPYELTDTYVLKIKSKDQRYPESERHLWMLKDSFESVAAEMFDKKGELWKGYTQTYGTVKTAAGEEILWLHSQSSTEFKTGFWVHNLAGSDIINDEKLEPAMFTPGALGAL